MGARIEKTVEHNVLGSGAHEREMRANQHLILARLAGIERLDENLLFGWKNQAPDAVMRKFGHKDS